MSEKHTGVVFVLRKPSGKVLIELRDDKSPAYPNTWVLPGGRMDKGETYMQTAIREAKEEFGVDLDEHSCALATTYSMPEFVEDNHLFVCAVPEDQAINVKESADAKWIDPAELKTMALGYKQEVFISKLLHYLENLEK